jgi:Pyruvate/2-oxoacid:ferredoxin oxidoreductase delta subunit
MTAKIVRKIIQIDEGLCNGCGACIQACAEGALELVNGKARLVSEKYCDGLAACLGECPQGAIRIVEKEAQGFDEEATQGHLNKKPSAAEVTCHCPGSSVKELTRPDSSPTALPVPEQESTLSHWPVQLALVPPGAVFLKGKDVVLIADCVPFAYPNLHRDFLKDRSVLVACPKLDDFAAHQAKLTAILQNAGIKSLTVVHMEVPCCSGLAYMAQQAMAASGIHIPFREVTIGIHGDIRAATGAVI